MTLDRESFDTNRREPLLEFDAYQTISEFTQRDKSKQYNIVNNSEEEQDYRARVSWTLVLHKLELAMLEYSGGNDLSRCEMFMQSALTELERHKNQFQHKSFFYWEPDSFQFLLWSMSFAVLSSRPDALQTIVRMLGKNPQGHDDPLLSMLLARLGYIGLPRLEELFFPKTYQHLYDAIKGDGVYPSKAERQDSLTQYLRGWYKGMKDCYWYGRHKKPIIFFGYWAFEAALVTLLYDLDDSGYSHMLYYPKDLVAHARSQGYDSLFPPSTAKHHIGFPNDETSIDGVWQCNLTDEVISLKKGERLSSKTENENDHKLFWVSE